MTTRTLAGSRVDVEHCDKCGGIWFERGELKRAAPEAIADFRPPEDARPGKFMCPRCFEALLHFRYAQTYVRVDMCAKCRGLWLDHREFEEISKVRQHLKERGKLDPDPIHGIKGALLEFIDDAIKSLNDFD